ncbi:MAG: PilZ domain-containing protein [Pseudomonadota bacterium]
MELRKVYVNSDGSAVFTCPHCGKSKTVNVDKFKDQKGPLRVRCPCQETYSVGLEFRRQYRKPSELNGMYTVNGSSMQGGRMAVRNVSMGGIGFVPKGRHRLSVGDIIEVKFTLDDGKDSVIQKRAVVRVVEGDYIGCQFDVQPGNYDAALGFYLRR